MITVITSKSAYAAKRLKIEATLRLRSGPNGNQWLKILDLKWLIDHDFKLPMQRGDVLYIRNPYFAGKPDYLLKIIKLAKRFKAQGGRVVDANIAEGRLGEGKWADYQKLKKAGLAIPKTKLLKDYPLPTTHYPLILKWIYGLKAKGTFLISSAGDLKKIPASIPKKELMIQEFVQAKYEYKVITVGYKALSVILKFKFNKKTGRVKFNSFSVIPASLPVIPASLPVIPASLPVIPASLPVIPAKAGIQIPNVKFHTGFNQMNSGSRVSPSFSLGLARDDKTNQLIKIAEKASKTLGRELSKIDILEDYRGKLYILEVNRFPGLKSFEELAKYNVVKQFLKYLTTVKK